MKSFFKMLLASFIGVFIASFLLLIITFGFIGAMISMGEQEVKLSEPTVLKLTFDIPVVDYSGGSFTDNFDMLTMNVQQSMELYKVLESIEKAASDPHISGIYMDLGRMNIGITAAEEIRRQLEVFKLSEKFIVCYADNYSQTAYYLASVADQIYLNPYGSALLKGISSEVMFYKKTLDKLGVDMQIIRHGKFKSAVEPFMTDKMSPENREQIETYAGSIWNFMMEEIAKTRGLSVDELNKLANGLVLKDAESALSNQLVTGIMYKDEVIAKLCQLMNVSSEKSLSVIDLSGYMKTPKKISKARNRVAVVYASGEIVMGDGSSGVSSDYISQAIRKARNDESIKAVVFRVNSPGGDAQASEIIARELELTAKEKPVIVSMGSLAASGGYWISTPGSLIMSNHTTLTGSIGVFGMVPNIQKGMNDLLGLTIDVAKTNTNADLLSVYRPLNAAEKDYIQGQIETIYDKFTTKVSLSRKMSKEAVDSIGQGRVWSGVNAMNIGLIDSFGGLKDAIALAANQANLSDYKVVQLPLKKDKFEELLSSFMSSKILGKNSATANDLKRTLSNYEHLLNAITQPGVKARMTYEVELH